MTEFKDKDKQASFEAFIAGYQKSDQFGMERF